MSYILDALKQSEGQRKQDAPPQVQPSQAFATRKIAPRRSGRLPLAIVLLVGVALLGWWTLDRKDGALGTTVSPVATTAFPAGAPGAIPGNAVSEVAPETRKGVAEMIVAAIGNDDLKGVRIQLQEPVVSPRSGSETAGPDAARESGDASRAEQRQPGASASMQNDVDPYAGLPYRRQLPVDVQRSLPELAFSVHIYSKDPASRRVKIGERMMREGQSITPQVRLEEIIPKGVILRYEDYRFRMSAL